MARALTLLLALGLLTGCGAGPNSGCVYSTFLSASPVSAVVDSTAAPPADQQKFTADSGEMVKSLDGSSCAASNVVELVYPAWSNPDPIDISISSANDATNGVATCKGPTAGAVSLTASIGSGANLATATVRLTCH